VGVPPFQAVFHIGRGSPVRPSATMPAVALMTLTQVNFVVSVLLYVAEMIFIGEEEKQLRLLVRYKKITMLRLIGCF
jgi:hypothetical protein